MKLTHRRSQERGHADHGWLDTYHSFSFADYYDPAHMGFRSLRVINQDVIAPGAGFPTHPHNDMEIFSYILWGALQHKDSMGNGRVLKPGQIQLMSAGRGVFHSEFNPSSTEGASLLQIWIRPHTRGLTPSYTEWHPDPAKENEPKVLVISPDGREGSATIHQDADIYRVRLAAGNSLTHEVRPGRGVWFQLIKGTVIAHGETLQAGDAFSTETQGSLELTASEDAEALLFDLA
ncbi:MAG: pirin family protein [Verrucomicrobiaceae bacterium]|nr:pirin family protein [Verrucomicrobiaceae bacterium]